MHAIKCGWVGRPFALAKHNESEGRKTRIRRSKEERKTLVEVFIKKYQESNNGSFPSLNLTHKEVGGSFYTVREIVRDVIQENRVLGPGKLLPEELTDQSFEENPLDSIAIEPQFPLKLSSKEADFSVNYNQCTSEELLHVSDEHGTPTNIQVPHNGPIINGSLVDVSDEAFDENLQGIEHNEVEERVEDELVVPITQVTPLEADLVVETFPLRPISRAISSSDRGSETWDSNGALDKQVNQTNGLESDVGLFDIKANHSTKTSSLVDEEAEKNTASVSSEKESNLVGVALVEHGEPIVVINEILNGSFLKEGSKQEVQSPSLEVCDDTPTPVTFEQGQNSTEAKAANALNCSQNLNEAFESGIDQASKNKEQTEAENKVDAQQIGGSQKESIPTLNRINLESWEGMSKNSSKPENNPLFAIFKAFVAAFVKFWSE